MISNCKFYNYKFTIRIVIAIVKINMFLKEGATMLKSSNLFDVENIFKCNMQFIA